MEGYDASTYGDRFADVYDDWYGDVTDVAACAEHLEALVQEAGGGPLLELGVGSGRLALPLVDRGVAVVGVDSSRAMLEALRTKPGGASVTLISGDMAALPFAARPCFAVVLVAFNTLFNLPTEARQQRCLEGVAAALQPEGRFVLEAFVPRDDLGPGTHTSVTPRRIAADEVVLSVSEVDAAAQTISGQHVHLSELGIRLRPWHLRYASPTQLDAMAASAGLVLERRTASWDGAPFTEASAVHVSTYRRGNVRGVRDDPPITPR